MSKLCKWLEEFSFICCNGDCEYVADNPKYSCKCMSKEDCKYYEEQEK